MRVPYRAQECGGDAAGGADPLPSVVPQLLAVTEGYEMVVSGINLLLQREPMGSSSLPAPTGILSHCRLVLKVFT